MIFYTTVVHSVYFWHQWRLHCFQLPTLRGPCYAQCI